MGARERVRHPVGVLVTTPGRRDSSTAYRANLLLNRCYRELQRLSGDRERGAQLVRRIAFIESIDRAWRAARPFDPTGL